MKVYTIGFTQRSAENFFETLRLNKVKTLLDIRLNNKSQLAGFTKEDDLKYFLKVILDINYQHLPQLAPTEDILKAYQKKEMSWQEYEAEYKKIITSREIFVNLDAKIFDGSCLLCSEKTPEKCHRRLFAEYLSANVRDVEIVHL